MDIRQTAPVVRKFVVLTCLTMFCFAVATFGSGLADLSALAPPTSGGESSSAAGALFPVLLFSLLLAAIFGFAILHSRWHGWKLIGAIFVTFFGLITIMTHTESIVFLSSSIHGALIVKFFVMGGIFAGLFAPTAVAVMGKLSPPADAAVQEPPAKVPFPEWAWKMIVIGACYLFIYNIFGYFIAWKNPAVQAFYGGVDEGNLFRHLTAVWESVPWMFPFQFGRGILWAAFALPVILMFRGQRWQAGLTVAFLFSVWSTQLLWPNPFMPREVTQVHFIETSTSNFLFGLIAGALLHVPRLSSEGRPVPAEGTADRDHVKA